MRYWTVGLILTSLLGAPACDNDKEDLIIEPPRGVLCCSLCDSNVVFTQDNSCAPNVSPVHDCARRSPCSDAYEYHMNGAKWCCRTDCNAPENISRTEASHNGMVCLYSNKCAVDSPCYKTMKELVALELSRTDDAWAIPADAGTDVAGTVDAPVPGDLGGGE